jgi:hypothetical protein
MITLAARALNSIRIQRILGVLEERVKQQRNLPMMISLGNERTEQTMLRLCSKRSALRLLQRWASTCNRHANGDKCDPLHCVHRLPMAAIAEGLPTLLDGAGPFLRLVARWNFCLTELYSPHSVADADGRPSTKRKLFFLVEPNICRLFRPNKAQSNLLLPGHGRLTQRPSHLQHSTEVLSCERLEPSTGEISAIGLDIAKSVFPGACCGRGCDPQAHQSPKSVGAFRRAAAMPDRDRCVSVSAPLRPRVCSAWSHG